MPQGDCMVAPIHNPWWQACPLCGESVSDPAVDAREVNRSSASMLLWLPLVCWGNPYEALARIRRCSRCHRLFQVPELRHGTMHCQSCGYDLRGSVTPTCPECGWTIPPALQQVIAQQIGRW